MPCTEADPDLIRGMTVSADATGETEAVETDVDLCKGARVYAYTIIVCWTSEDPDEAPPPILASLHLQDSRIDVPSACNCKNVSLGADLPGLKWPNSAKLVAEPGSNAVLILTYGQCA